MKAASARRPATSRQERALRTPVDIMRVLMRRLLLVFLLMFLPFQGVWAAALPYCSHETAPEAAHFGHHAHEHQAAVQHLGEASSVQDGPSIHPLISSATGADMDCHACHGVGNAMFAHAGGYPLWAAGARPMLHTQPALTAPRPHRPERPNWPSLA